jgi:A/G-specific adenine glycosylase
MIDPGNNTKRQLIVQSLREWFFDNRRSLPWRENRTAYGTWVSETMLQQTRVATVIPYYNRFLALFPDILTLSAAPQEEVYKVWEGLGYYSRARNLQNGAKYCADHFGGNLPDSIKLLLSIPGIGPYTAGAIASLAFGLPEPAVDGNVIRVFSRLFALFIYPQDVKARKEIAEIVRKLLPVDNAADFNEAVMDLGAAICTPTNPNCKACPLSTLCEAFLIGKQKDLPLRKPKRENPVIPYTILVLQKGDEFFIRKRPNTGLLANLFEFPSFPGLLTKDELEDYIYRDFGISSDQIVSVTPLGSADHSFSHLKWQMEGYLVAVCDRGQSGEAGSDNSLRYLGEQQKVPALLPFAEKQLQGDFYPISAINRMAFPSAIRAYTSAVFHF